LREAWLGVRIGLAELPARVAITGGIPDGALSAAATGEVRDEAGSGCAEEIGVDEWMSGVLGVSSGDSLRNSRRGRKADSSRCLSGAKPSSFHALSNRERRLVWTLFSPLTVLLPTPRRVRLSGRNVAARCDEDEEVSREIEVEVEDSGRGWMCKRCGAIVAG
jgi:hypothetical protein